jgi:hypothetical protein
MYSLIFEMLAMMIKNSTYKGMEFLGMGIGHGA